ncbi:MAG: manganese efflux pump MntP family protein [Tuberibacillus sp.]
MMMALALGMDAFSVGMGMGMIDLRLKQIAKIGLTIGLFHVIMPLLGMGIGHVLSDYFGTVAHVAGGILLLLLGAQMIFSSFQQEDSTLRPVGFGLILFALSVSLDSFSVGLSLGIFGARVLVTIMMFGLVSMFLTWAGLLVGRKFQHLFGPYSEVLGGCILFAFGIKLMLQM